MLAIGPPLSGSMYFLTISTRSKLESALSICPLGIWLTSLPFPDPSRLGYSCDLSSVEYLNGSYFQT